MHLLTCHVLVHVFFFRPQTSDPRTLGRESQLIDDDASIVGSNAEVFKLTHFEFPANTSAHSQFSSPPLRCFFAQQPRRRKLRCQKNEVAHCKSNPSGARQVNVPTICCCNCFCMSSKRHLLVIPRPVSTHNWPQQLSVSPDSSITGKSNLLIRTPPTPLPKKGRFRHGIF